MFVLEAFCFLLQVTQSYSTLLLSFFPGMVSGTTNAYFLFRSNWQKISEDVIAISEHEELLASKNQKDSIQSSAKRAKSSRGGLALPDHLTHARTGLQTLAEASFDENSSTASSFNPEAGGTPDTTPEKELV